MRAHSSSSPHNGTAAAPHHWGAVRAEQLVEPTLTSVSATENTSDLGTRTIAPMKAQPGDNTIGDNWVYELKWDGMRQLLHITHDGVRVQSSNERNVTASFPELAPLQELLGGMSGLVLDGEAVAFDDDGRPSFAAMQRRMHISDPAEAARRSTTTPIMFVAFDVLHVDGHDTFALPLSSRRELLDQVFDDGPNWKRSSQHPELAPLLDVVNANHLEGVVAKRPTSTYQPGRRSPDWLKIKPRRRQEFVVGGWTAGQGNRAGRLGSLLVGFYDGDKLRYAGRAGSGLTDTTIAEWQSLLSPVNQCPFATTPALPRDRNVQWCDPSHVVEIAFGEWSGDHHLRHPVVLGRRTDKHPQDVVRESH